MGLGSQHKKLVSFEDETDFLSYVELCRWNPDLPEGFFFLDYLQTHIFPDVVPWQDSRRAFLTALPDDLRNHHDGIWNLMTTLRLIGVTDGQHVETIFARVSPSPVRVLIQKILTEYLDSSVSHDALFAFQNQPEALPFDEVTWVRSSFLPTTLSSITFGELFPREGKKRPHQIHGKRSSSLERLARTIAKAKQPVVVSLSAPTAETRLLCCLLDQKRVRYQLHPALTTKPFSFVEVSPFDQLMRDIRGDKALSVKRRLSLGKTLVKLQAQRILAENLLPTLKTLNQREELPSDDLDYLTTRLTQQSTLPEVITESGDVFLTPFQIFPISEGFQTLYYHSEVTFPADWYFFTPQEWQKIAQLGFASPTAKSLSQIEEKKLQLLSQTAPERRIVYSPSKILDRGRSTILKEQKKNISEDFVDDEITPLLLARFSATGLETLAECPAKFFYNRFLKIDSRFSFFSSVKIQAGSLIHALLKELAAIEGFKHFSTERLREELKRLWAEKRKLLPNISFHLAALIEHDLGDIATAISLNEKKIHDLLGETHPFVLETPVQYHKDDLTISGQIDRIDKASDGSLLILDYKTGAVDFSPEQIKKGTHFQALSYALATASVYRTPINGVAFYDLNKGELKRGIFVEDRWKKETKKEVTRGHFLSADATEALLNEGWTHARELAASFRAGKIPAHPSATHCQSCSFAIQCRRSHEYLD